MPQTCLHLNRAFAILAVSLSVSTLHAWDAPGHRAVTEAALHAFTTGSDAPAWLSDANIKAQVADHSVTPDRWRSTKIGALKHINEPDHYLDVEELADFDLSLRTMSPFRMEYLRQMALAKERKGNAFTGKRVNPAADPARYREWPGFLAHSMVEQYSKVQSAFRIVRVLEKLNQPARANQLEMAKKDAMGQMGILSHFVGDCAQPLHTTKHFNGWVGDNPNEYTTDKKFHSYIDGAILRIHKLDAAAIQPFVRADFTVEASNPWEDGIAHIERSFETVEHLYKLKKSGELEKEQGKQFITSRLADGATMLAAMYKAAWKSAEPTDEVVKDFLRWDGFDGDERPE